MPDLRQQDETARRRALDVSGSFLVQAPAGSGKTELLIQRYLRLLGTVEEPEQVVAITFTRKAAGEMRQRVLDALRGAEEGTEFKPHEAPTREAALALLERDAARGWGLRQSPGRLRLFTVDALALTMVQRMPFSARMGAAPEVTEKAEHLYERAAHATVQALGGEDEAAAAARRVLRHLDNNVAELERMLAAMLAKRDQWLRHLEGAGSGDEVRARLEEALGHAIRGALAEVRRAIPEEHAAELVELAAFAAQRATKDNTEKLAACRQLARLPGVETADMPAWLGLVHLLVTGGGTWRAAGGMHSGMGFPKESEEKDRITALLDALRGNDVLRELLAGVPKLPAPRYSPAQWEVLEALLRLLPRAEQELQRVFASAGGGGRAAVDFIEITRAALRALGGGRSADLALGMGHAIHHLLMDEFQDTSVSQLELLKSITAGWKAGDGRTLFLVGDPMQSVYRFRQAEVGLFLEVRQQGRLGAVEVEPLTLARNFRSQQNLVDWVNRAFAQVFPAEEDVARAAVRYEPCQGSRPGAAGLREQVHAFFRDDYAAEAERVVSLIRAARRRDPAGRVAVLVRARAHLSAIVPALKRAGIRFRALEIDRLDERPVIVDLVALTRALLHPADRPAWLAVLRAPWCGLTLADLVALCGGEGAREQTVWEQMEQAGGKAISGDGRERLARARAVLGAALEARLRLPLRRWVEATWLGLAGPACGTSSTDLADAAAYFNLLEELEEGGELDLALLERRMEALYGAPDPAAEHVQLLTIHLAKGLEFETVIVPGLGRSPRSDEKRLLLWEERAHAQGSQLLLAPVSETGGESKDAAYQFLKKAEQERTAHEERRLLYVAATRARDQLHLVGHALPKEKDGEVTLGAPERTSLLHHLWPVVEEEFQRQWEEQGRPAAAVIPGIAAAAEDALAERPRLRRLPAGWQPPPLPAPLAGGAPREQAGELAVTYEWVGPTARHVGTVVHLVLQSMAREGLAAWEGGRLRSQLPLLGVLLASEGVPPAEMPKAVEKTLAALEGTLRDPRGRWILAPHPEAQSEFALSGEADGRLWRVQIDRTFVHEGVRWIVDFKTSFHQGSGREAFLDNERQRYREKMELYAALLSRLHGDALPLRLGLYFPLLGGWREWEPAPAEQPAG
jgi:ATP-dependent helicase/nuclease subunit A